MKYTLITLAALSGTAFAQSIVNGSFDASGSAAGISTLTPSGAWNQLPNGTTSDVRQAGEFSFAASNNGGAFVTSAALGNNATTEGLTQDISGLTIGQDYTISYEFGHGRLNPTYSQAGFWQVGIAGTTSNSALSTTAWQNGSHTFTATAATETLVFTSQSAPGSTGVYLGIDGVSIQPVPEPSSAALLGLGGLALILRRRK